MNNEKTRSVIAYLFGFISGLIILLMKDSEKNTKFHAAQSITIFLGYYLIDLCYEFIPFGIPYFEYILRALYLISIVTGIVKACRDVEPELPIIGDVAKKLFNKQIND